MTDPTPPDDLTRYDEVPPAEAVARAAVAQARYPRGCCPAPGGRTRGAWP